MEKPAQLGPVSSERFSASWLCPPFTAGDGGGRLVGSGKAGPQGEERQGPHTGQQAFCRAGPSHSNLFPAHKPNAARPGASGETRGGRLRGGGRTGRPRTPVASPQTPRPGRQELWGCDRGQRCRMHPYPARRAPSDRGGTSWRQRGRQGGRRDPRREPQSPLLALRAEGGDLPTAGGPPARRRDLRPPRARVGPRPQTVLPRSRGAAGLLSCYGHSPRR